jgi:hypothetical protein
MNLKKYPLFHGNANYFGELSPILRNAPNSGELSPVPPIPEGTFFGAQSDGGRGVPPLISAELSPVLVLDTVRLLI